LRIKNLKDWLVKEAGESLEELAVRKAIQEMIDEVIALMLVHLLKETLFSMEQPHLGDKEALGTIEKIPYTASRTLEI
jgi:hypothetical protein